MNPIEIDGSFGEGGGAVLRMASALAAVTGNSLHVFNIRKSRPKGGGLGVQHLKGLEAIAELCNGRLENADLGSKEIWFYPGEIQAKDLSIKIETAGSIALVLQTLIFPCLFAPSSIKISFDGGATDTFFSPTIDYFRFVFLKILDYNPPTASSHSSLCSEWAPKMGAKVEVAILKRGYYPEGGAKVEVKVFSSKLKFLNLIERGQLKKLLVISGASETLKDKKVAERQAAGVREVLGKLKLPTEEKIEYYDTRCPGSQICLIAEFENTVIGTDNLGKLGKRAEDVGKEAALELLKEQKSGACLDKHLADQILPYAALSFGKSQFTVSEITNHCKTNIWVIEKFINGKFEIKGNLIVWQPF